MKQKILAALVAINGQYNLPKEMLEKIAGTAPTFESEDKIQSWVDAQKPYLGFMQSYADSRVTGSQKELDALKAKIAELEKNKPAPAPTDDLDKKLGAILEEKMKSVNETIEKQASLITTLQTQLDASSAATKAAQFAELTKRIAGELKLSDKAMAMLQSRLSDEMDEAKVNEVLSQGKKDLLDMGLREVETGAPSTNVEQEKINNYAEEFLKAM